MLEISPSAIKEIKRIQLNSTIPESKIRLAVKSGGCSGFFYALQLEDLVVADNEHQLSTSEDLKLEINTISLIIDPESWKHIQHLKIDYSEDLMGGGFRFHNPQVKNVCGCGISFTQATLN